jgi:hypothetical protein
MDTKKLAIHINTHSGHRRFIKPCLESVRKMDPLMIVCSYNTLFYDDQNHPVDLVLPEYDTLCLADRWIIGDYGPRVNAWIWLHKYGLAVLNNGLRPTRKDDILMRPEECDYVRKPDYIFGMEGDCVVDNPDGIHTIFDMMESQKADIICAEFVYPNYASATSYLGKKDVVNKVVDHILLHAYEAHTSSGEAFGNMEGRMGKAICLQGFKCAEVKNPESSHFSFGYRGTWGDVLGFRHLHGTEKWRLGYHHKPLPRKYYDLRYMWGSELAALEGFWSTGSTDSLYTYGYWQPISKEFEDIGNRYKEEI